MWFIELAKYAPIIAFALVCASYYAIKLLVCAPSKFVRARAEAMCNHSWELLRSGPLVENIGEYDEKCVGTYSLYRCTACGASRNYR